MDKFIIKLEGEGVKKQFGLPLLEMEEKAKKIPELTYDSSIDMDSTKLKEAVEDMNHVSMAMSIRLLKEQLELQAEGDLKDIKIELDTGEDIKLNGDGKELENKARYSTEYMTKLTEGSKIAKNVKVEFKKDYPLRLTYAVDNLEVIYILAPRVDND